MSKCGCHDHHGHRHHGHHGHHGCNGHFHFHSHGGCGCGHHGHHGHHGRCGCHGRFPIHCSPFDLCVDRLRMRLAHLGGNFGFELHRHIGCRVEIEHVCGEAVETIRGKICGVGGTLVHLSVKEEGVKALAKKKEDQHVVSIPINHICKVRWLQNKCNPCHHGCHCGCGCKGRGHDDDHED